MPAEHESVLLVGGSADGRYVYVPKGVDHYKVRAPEPAPTYLPHSNTICAKEAAIEVYVRSKCGKYLELKE